MAAYMEQISVEYIDRTILQTFDKDSQICPICYENYVPDDKMPHRPNMPVRLEVCKHTFCMGCLCAHVREHQSRSTCPICRTNLLQITSLAGIYEPAWLDAPTEAEVTNERDPSPRERGRACRVILRVLRGFCYFRVATSG